ncbi:tRNA N6-adenosine threonylcarbamoyltransferase, mitochondrial [Bombina bombina]|uniref:tRNA N6-adenosine threonylcarbamoyltransferase, mitochondrial n=1 Tax=Bombina bombina TaxID=8345 RepID=UPI00235AC6B6|nr:tRNA N6-adenosine threonylcarbamoyltransferase, mitochondrial [Bombina bombina]XP_053554582.1 tRNA N6-adenosine threonylcarbamoyltransferase, mitochondrial [Bombina bombina]
MARYLRNLHKVIVGFGRGSACFHSQITSPRLVLGIETSCDDTGAAVVDENGKILGESLHSQKEVHLKTGGIVPPVAQQLHRDNIYRVVTEALVTSGVSPHELSAIATTVKPGLALSLGVGLSYSLKLVNEYHKPFIPIHHMEAHALTVRLLHPIEFPFLVLLISGGHCILALANGVSDFLLLGQSQDEAPGDTLDKVARQLSLINHPECSSMGGGQAIEHLARYGNRLLVHLRTPMSQHKDCNFSFAGLRSQVNNIIQKKEAEEGIHKGQVLSCVSDIAASVQHTVARHIAKRTQRAIIYCKKEGLLPPAHPFMVVSGGVASNGYIRTTLQSMCEAMDVSLLFPPPQLCTDNGVMIAWNGIEKLRIGSGIMYDTEGICYEPRAPLGIDISEHVREAAIKLPPLKNRTV